MQDKYFREELSIIKAILDKTPLEIAIKWGGEVYQMNGKKVVSYGGFKNHFCLWFYDGVFLSDPLKVLINANEEKTKALRQWRFTSAEQINEAAILNYVDEAIKNLEQGITWKPQKSQELAIPDLLMEQFRANNHLELAFSKLSPYKRKEYIEHIQDAKQEKTKIARIEKALPLILAGKGLNDKYK